MLDARDLRLEAQVPPGGLARVCHLLRDEGDLVILDRSGLVISKWGADGVFVVKYT